MIVNLLGVPAVASLVIAAASISPSQPRLTENDKIGVTQWSSNFNHLCFAGANVCNEYSDAVTPTAVQYTSCQGMTLWHTLYYVTWFCQA